MNPIGEIGFGSPDTASLKESLIAQHKDLPPNDIPNSLRVYIVREPFDEFYSFLYDDGKSDEFDDEQARAYLSEHGAAEELVDKVMTQAWNFYRAVAVIKNPIYPKEKSGPLTPRIDPV